MRVEVVAELHVGLGVGLSERVAGGNCLAVLEAVAPESHDLFTPGPRAPRGRPGPTRAYCEIEDQANGTTRVGCDAYMGRRLPEFQA